MTSGKSTYRAVLRKAELDTIKRLDGAFQRTTIVAINRMIDLTPVLTGAAKYHWFVRPLPDEKFDKTQTDLSGQKPKSRAKRDIKLFRAGQFVWLVNSAPYFEFLDKGSSAKRPEGITAIVKAEVPHTWDKEIQTSFYRDPKYNE